MSQTDSYVGFLNKGSESQRALQVKDHNIPIDTSIEAPPELEKPKLYKITGQIVRNDDNQDVIVAEKYEEVTTQFTGVAQGDNRLKVKNKVHHCYQEIEAGEASCAEFKLPLNLDEYKGETITITGEQAGSNENQIHNASVVKAPAAKPSFPGEDFQQAKSLKDLLLIRQENRQEIEKYNNNLGSALGLKYKHGFSTGKAAILIFVPQKINLNLLPESQHIPKYFISEKHKIWCHVDVVAGGRKASLQEIDPLPALEALNESVTGQLQAGWPGLIGGMQVGALDPRAGFSYVGTAGIAVKERNSQRRIGFLTNQHVADRPGREIFFPSYSSSMKIGRTQKVEEFATVKDWYDKLIEDTNAMVRCDCGYFSVDPDYDDHVQPGVFGLDVDLSNIETINMKDMKIIGRKVVSVGRTRGFQRGTVVAYAYEFVDEENISMYTDLLIANDDGNAFSWKGDSGKIILTDEPKPKPLALLWGGWQERLRHNKAQEMWSYAIDLRKVLERLGLEIYKG
jgi:hypothetical protein